MINPDVVTVTSAVDAAVKMADDPEVTALANQALPVNERLGRAELDAFFKRAENLPDLPQSHITHADGSLDNEILSAALTKLREEESSLPTVERGPYLRARDALSTIQSLRKDIVTVDPELLTALVPGEIRDDRVVTTDAIRKVMDKVYVAVLTNTFFLEHRTFEEAKQLLDPLNWPMVTKFFRAMTPQNPAIDSEGWGRVLEEVGTVNFAIHNALKYWKGEAGDGANKIAFVNYDLDDEKRRAGDDGWAVVDNGCLTVRSIDDKVTVHITKELLIRGLSPIATAVLGRSVGWEMVALDVFDNPVLPDDLHPWQVSEKPDQAVDIPEVRPKVATLLPPRTRSAVIGITRDQIDTALVNTANFADDAVTRWHNGLTEDDIKALNDHANRSANEFTIKMFNVPAELFLADEDENDPVADRVGVATDQETPP